MCVHEPSTPDGSGGRCDLWFKTTGADPWVLAVELKHNAAYGERQPEKYLDDLRGCENSALVVITGRRHPEVDEELKADPRWLGEVRWSAIAADLEKIAFEPGHSLLGEAWRALIHKMRSDGDLGARAMGLSDFVMWAEERGSSDFVSLLLDEIAGDAETMLAAQVKRSGFSCELTRTAAGQLVRRDTGMVILSFDVDDRKRRLENTVELELTPIRGRLPEVVVHFLPSDADDLADDLRAGGFESLMGTWGRTFPIDYAHLKSGTDLADVILKEWQIALRGLKALEPFRSARATRPEHRRRTAKITCDLQREAP